MPETRARTGNPALCAAFCTISVRISDSSGADPKKKRPARRRGVSGAAWRTASDALDDTCDALTAGGVKPAVLNAANEVAVAAFLDGRITFAAIAAIVAAALDQVAQADDLDLQAILDADRAARIVAARLV